MANKKYKQKSEVTVTNLREDCVPIEDIRIGWRARYVDECHNVDEYLPVRSAYHCMGDAETGYLVNLTFDSDITACVIDFYGTMVDVLIPMRGKDAK
jgi:hypothetical protein